MTTAVLVLAGATSTGGVAALIMRKLRGHGDAKKTPKQPQSSTKE
jgi:hypothetical protein